MKLIAAAILMTLALPAAAQPQPYAGQHALELADQLGLSTEQRTAIQALMDSHKGEARTIGKSLVEAERSLEQLFRSGNVPQTALAEAVRKAAALHGEYRLSHLETHRRLRPLLSEEQVARYNALRGYAASAKQHTHKH